MWYLGMALVGYGSNDKKLKSVWRRVMEWMAPHPDCNNIYQKYFHLQYTKDVLGLCNKE